MSTYRKIPIINLRAYFWSKGFFEKNFLEGAYIQGSLYMDEYLPFENTIFCSSNCNFLRFSAHNLSLLLNFSLFLFLINKCTYNCQYHIVELIKYLPPKFNVMFKFTYSKYNPWALIFRGGAYTWKKFSLSKVSYTRWGLLLEFYG